MLNFRLLRAVFDDAAHSVFADPLDAVRVDGHLGMTSGLLTHARQRRDGVRRESGAEERNAEISKTIHHAENYTKFRPRRVANEQSVDYPIRQSATAVDLV